MTLPDSPEANYGGARAKGAMGDTLLKAQHYRDQAAQMRALAAKSDNDEEIRNALTALAANYERLCEKFMALAASERSGQQE